MASQSLYRKWRSQTFSDLVGQEAVVRTLQNALKSGNLAHAYLFTGPRGTGKTSTARLLAKTINCLHPVNGEPCNECQQCREITMGNSFNVIEIDAASNRGIDNIRDLREKVMMPPVTGKYKVYILDEAHMLTTEAFNALLKTLEEPPSHTIFVMATTDVHKMLPTVLSRCQRFDFKRITTRQIVNHLDFVARHEAIKLERGAAELIARAAAGGMRDALSLLDQAVAYSGQEILLTQVQAMLGVADPRAIQKFIMHVAQLDSAAGLHLIHELAEAGADLRQLNTQVAEYWRALMLAKAGADIAVILDCTDDEVREMRQTMQLFALEELTEYARIFAQNDLAYKNQGTPQLGLELALLTSIEIHRRAQPDRLLAASAPPVQAKQPIQPTAQPTAPVVQNSSQPPVPAAAASFQKPVSEPVEKQVVPVVEEALQQSQGSELPNGDEVSPSLTIDQVKEKWELVKRRVRTKRDGAKIAAILNGYTITGVEGPAELPIVILKAAADFHYKALQKEEHHETIGWALKLELGQQCHVRLVPPGYTSSSVQIPPPLASPKTSTPSAHTTTTAVPRQSAFREPPAPELSQPTPAKEPSTQPKNEPEASTSAVESDPPLARTSIVRENTSNGNATAPYESRQDVLRQKAMRNPVIQEVVRIFKAEIKEVHPK